MFFECVLSSQIGGHFPIPLNAGSLDNLTAVVVALRGYKSQPIVASSVAEPFLMGSRPNVGWLSVWPELGSEQPVPKLSATAERRSYLFEASWLDPTAAHHMSAF